MSKRTHKQRFRAIFERTYATVPESAEFEFECFLEDFYEWFDRFQTDFTKANGQAASNSGELNSWLDNPVPVPRQSKERKRVSNVFYLSKYRKNLQLTPVG